MTKKSEVQCDYKRFLIDSFESNGVAVKVFVFANKKHVKIYCKQTEMEFADGLRKLYIHNHRN